MNLPLARLLRGTQQVWLHDRLSPPPVASPAAAASPPSPSPGSAPAPSWPTASPSAQAARPSAPSARPTTPPAAAAPAFAQPFRMMGVPPAAPVPAAAPAMETPASLMDIRRGKRRSFWRAEDAVHYLRYWRHDPGACSELRRVLQRLEPSNWVFTHTDDRVIQALGTAIAQGLLIVTESAQPASAAGLPGVPAPPAAPAAPLALTVAPIKPPVPPLLPVLEEVQIEGAEVLPEIMQSLEQIDLTLGEIKIAPVSLAPTPSKIPEIESAMSAASGSVTKTLDEL